MTQDGTLARDSFRINISITETNMRFSNIILGHKQLKSLGIGMLRDRQCAYLFEEIDANYSLSGKIFSIPRLNTLLIRDIIKKNTNNNTTEADRLQGHLHHLHMTH